MVRPQINIKNVMTMDPEDIFNEMERMYGNIEVQEYISGLEDLDRITQMLGWCTNNKSYLSSLGVYLDIATRNAKRQGDKDQHSEMVCRKNIVKTYYDIISDIYTACSRQATLYLEQRREMDEERRLNNIQYGRSGPVDLNRGEVRS